MLSMLFYLQLLPSVTRIIYRILLYIMYMYILFGYSNVTLLAFVQSFIVEYMLNIFYFATKELFANTNFCT